MNDLNKLVNKLFKEEEEKKFTEDSEKYPNGKKAPSIGASSFSLECEKALWMRAHHIVEDPITISQSNIFETGHYLEEMMIKLLERIGCKIDYTLENQLYLEYKKYIHCYTDGIIKESPFSKNVMLLEMKTANSNNFKQIKQNGYKQEHYLQIQTYLYLLDKLRKDGKLPLDLLAYEITECLYVVYNKDSGEIFTNIIKRDEKFTSIIEDKIEKSIKLCEKENMDGLVENLLGCTYCSFKRNCERSKEKVKKVKLEKEVVYIQKTKNKLDEILESLENFI